MKNVQQRSIRVPDGNVPRTGSVVGLGVQEGTRIVKHLHDVPEPGGGGYEQRGLPLVISHFEISDARKKPFHALVVAGIYRLE